MQALKHFRLVKSAATGVQTKVVRPKSVTGQAKEKKIGSRFLDGLLAALAAWAV
jgi:hypothetical protein